MKKNKYLKIFKKLLPGIKQRNLTSGIKMAGGRSLLLLTVTMVSAFDYDFDFDHAFRKTSEGEEVTVESLMRRIGLAMGEEEEAAEPLATDTLLRRLGELEDQHAVETQVGRGESDQF